ncbi:MAG: sigma-70 family RNA polymerase sigma factor [Bacteroidota bacterium]
MKCPIKYSTAEILAASQRGGQPLETICNHVIEVLCNCNAFVGTVFRHVKSRGGNQEDGEDLLQDGLTQLLMSLVNKKFQGGSSIENYAFGICKNLWMNRSQKHETTKVVYLGEDARKEDAATENTETDWLQNEQDHILWSIIKKMTGKCPQFLEYWALGFSHKEVAEKMEISERRSLNATSECRKKLRNWIEAHPKFAELLR